MYAGDQYSQIPCAAHKARLENLKSYAAYFGIKGNISKWTCVCTDDDHNPLNVPDVPHPPRNDPTRMFVPGNNIIVIIAITVFRTTKYYLLCTVCFTGTYQPLQQEHYANLGRKLNNYGEM